MAKGAPLVAVMSRRAARLAVAVLILCALLHVHPSQAAQERDNAIFSFYTTSAAAAAAWDGSPPVSISHFVPGTARVYYYIFYDGVIADHASMHITLHNPGGSVSSTRWFTLSSPGEALMGYFHSLIAFAPGRYRFEAQIVSESPLSDLARDVSTATTTFTVEPGLVIPSFYPVSLADYQSAFTRTMYFVPPEAGSYPGGTGTMAIRFTYAGATPGRTRWQVAVRDASGTLLAVFPAQPAVLHYVVGWEMLGLPRDPSWPPGDYRLELLIDGAVASTTATRVLSAAPPPVRPALLSACSGRQDGPSAFQLYATNPGAMAGWIGSQYKAPPRLTVVPPGTRTITWYFRYPHAVPGSTYFQMFFGFQEGDALLLSDSFTAQCADGAWMGTFSSPTDLPPGTYMLWVAINGANGPTSLPIRVL